MGPVGTEVGTEVGTLWVPLWWVHTMQLLTSAIGSDRQDDDSGHLQLDQPTAALEGVHQTNIPARAHVPCPSEWGTPRESPHTAAPARPGKGPRVPQTHPAASEAFVWRCQRRETDRWLAVRANTISEMMRLLQPIGMKIGQQASDVIIFIIALLSVQSVDSARAGYKGW